jgi:molybdate transport system substrate-binding protein
MATKSLLGELVGAFQARTGQAVALESAGGVDVARRVQAGQSFDVVVLARDAIDKLLAEAHLVRGTDLDLARSGVAVAVRAGAPRPDVGTEADFKRVIVEARAIGISTGPSGVQLQRLFERWGLARQLRDRVVTAPPGVPVGTLVARGEVDLGLQQLSELIALEGIDVLGPLPAPTQITTVFAGALARRARQPDPARHLLTFLASASTSDAKRRHGMEPP